MFDFIELTPEQMEERERLLAEAEERETEYLSKLIARLKG